MAERTAAAGSCLLIELGCEEIPARMVGGLARELAAGVEQRLRAAALLTAEAPAAEAAWTPRRLLVRQTGVLAAQPDREEELIGPPVKAGVTAEGGFSSQAVAFAARQGVDAGGLYRVRTPKGEYVAVRRRTAGSAAAAVLAIQLPAAVAALDLPRAMRWETGRSFRFIRPLRWLLALLDDRPVAVELAGLRSAPQSFGHRTLAPGAFAVPDAAGFPAAWEAHGVVAHAPARQARIERAAAAALAASGWRLRPDPGLTEILVNLTEFPDVVVGAFDAGYLRRLPEEVLVTVMRDHQKYFALEDAEGRLREGFLAVVNLDGDREGLIRHGNERVLRARFNDACFFWDADRKLTLEARRPLLGQVTFHARLGNYLQKSERMESLASWLAAEWGEDAALAAAAARLAKCDLTSELVKEFTELQGIVGGRLAEAEGLPAPLAAAIRDQYLPLAVNGPAPATRLAAAVAVADKLDSIAGLFALGEIPTGSADPFALRRQANGIVRTLIAHDLGLDLDAAWNRALARHGATENGDETRAALAVFLRERIAFYLREVDGLAYDTVNAVLAAGANDPLDARARARALDHARRRLPEEFNRVAQALKRMRNIVKKEGGVEQWLGAPVNPARFEPAEAALALAVTSAAAPGRDHGAQLQAIAGLWEPLDRFFNEVRVNADDAGLRANRLALLAWAVTELSRLADFVEIAG